MASVSLKAIGKVIADDSNMTTAGTVIVNGTSGAMIATTTTGTTMGIAIATDL
jgi:hypothetical protein